MTKAVRCPRERAKARNDRSLGANPKHLPR